MKKIITIILITLSLLLILDSMNFGQTLIMFYLAGIIPGTNIAIGATEMLEFFAVVTGFTLARIMTVVTTLRRLERYSLPKAGFPEAQTA